MTLATVRAGDVVQVAGSLARVLSKERGRLQIQWAGTRISRWAKATEVQGHWKRVR